MARRRRPMARQKIKKDNEDFLKLFSEAYNRTNKYYKDHMEEGYFYLVSVDKKGSLQDISEAIKSVPSEEVKNLINWNHLRIGLWETSHLFITAKTTDEKNKYRGFVPIFIYMKDHSELEKVYWHYRPPRKLNKFDIMEV